MIFSSALFCPCRSSLFSSSYATSSTSFGRFASSIRSRYVFLDLDESVILSSSCIIFICSRRRFSLWILLMFSLILLAISICMLMASFCSISNWIMRKTLILTESISRSSCFLSIVIFMYGNMRDIFSSTSSWLISPLVNTSEFGMNLDISSIVSLISLFICSDSSGVMVFSSVTILYFA